MQKKNGIILLGMILSKTGTKMKKKLIFKEKPKELSLVRKRKEVDYETHREKYQKRHTKKRFWVRFFVVIAVIVGAIVFLNSSFFDVDTIAVEGNEYFESDQIINMANASKGGNVFWGSNKGEIKERLLDNPYIEDVETSVKLPRTLVITVTERKQEAYIKLQKKKYLVLDGKGVVLRETSTKPMLTEIVNIKIRKTIEGEELQPIEAQNFKKILKIINTMDEKNIFFSKIMIKQGKVYAYVYEKLICKGSYKNFTKLLDNGKLGKILYKLSKEGIKRGTVTIGDGDYISFNPAL